ncbi:restriction endonuclease subunit S [Acinetobacter nosocomialis]|uniref:restriction endonuclease subunit S n=1 Tax=Acinetobacter nosocomialis TaxID=106654 RepID=UPI0024DEAFA8|nr:restriction endonuclease subunit S [Acinetobacter nosocomialis]
MTQSNLTVIDSQAIPMGFKKTELGFIPEDWQVYKLSEIIKSIQLGGNYPNSQNEKGCPLIKMGNLNRGSINLDKIEFIQGDCSKRDELSYGDLLFNTRNTPELVGKVAIWRNELPVAYFNSNIMRIKFRDELVSNNFYINYVMNTKQFIDSLGLIATGTTSVAAIYTRDLLNLNLVLPPYKEQEKIATALSDTDALISELEKLIEKKQAIKTATMQQLLTGKTRLPEFALRDDGTPKTYKDSELGQIPEDWDAFEINEVVENIIDYRGRTPKKLGMDWGGGNIVALSAGNVRKGYIDFGAECYLGSELLYKKWMCNGEAQKDDIAFTMEAPLGNVALIPDHSKYILSQRTILLQINRQEFDPHFIFHLLMSNEFEKYISDQATGSTAQGVKRSLFEKLKLVLPIKLSEQKSISQILDDFDFEIEKLKQKLKKLQLIKQGMMQELLTGKTRLV